MTTGDWAAMPKASRRMAMGRDAEGEPAGGPGAKPPGWGLGARPPKDTPFGFAAKARSAEQPNPNPKGRPAVRSLGVASPRGADAGPRGEVSGESLVRRA